MSNTIVYINENNELITENPTTTATDIGTNISKDLNIGTKLHKINVNDSMVINGNLSIKGNMSVYGNTSIVHSDIIRVDDPLIYLAQNNNKDELNIGFYGSYKNSGNTRFTGFIRDPKDSTFKILDNVVETFTNLPSNSFENEIKTKFADLKVKNLQTTHNLNVDGNINVKRNLNVYDSITTPNINISTNLKIPVSDNGTNILSTIGHIYYNNTSGLYEGYGGKNNKRWNSLGGINPYEDTIITHNLTVNKNLNVLGNTIIHQNLNVKSNLNVTENLKINGTVSGDGDLSIGTDATVGGTMGVNGLKLDGTLVTASATELNILDGCTASTAELNYLHISTLGTSEVNKVVTADSQGLVTINNGIIVKSSNSNNSGYVSFFEASSNGTNNIDLHAPLITTHDYNAFLPKITDTNITSVNLLSNRNVLGGTNLNISNATTDTITVNLDTTISGLASISSTNAILDGLTVNTNPIQVKGTSSSVGYINLYDNGTTNHISLQTATSLGGSSFDLILPSIDDTLVSQTSTDTLKNKTLRLPKILDTSDNHNYIFGVSELTANRTITLPLLTGNDTFVFENHTQTLTNKTINSSSATLTSLTVNNLINVKGISNGRGYINFYDEGTTKHISLLTEKAIGGGSNSYNLILPSIADTLITKTSTDTLTNKTLKLPKILDTNDNYNYIFGVSQLNANRTITLPLLSANDTFVFENHTQTLTNKTINSSSATLTSLTVTGSITGSSYLNVSGKYGNNKAVWEYSSPYTYLYNDDPQSGIGGSADRDHCYMYYHNNGSELAFNLPNKDTTSSSHFNFNSGLNNELFRIESTGKVGIGTTQPSQKLHVAGNVLVAPTGTATTYPLVVTGAFSAPATTTGSALYYSTVDGERVIAINGAVNMSAKFEYGLWVESGTELWVSSDERIKKNIEPYNNGLDLLRQLEVKSFNYIDGKDRNSKHKELGFIAQEVQKILPSAVTLTEEYIPNIYKLIKCVWIPYKNKYKMKSSDLPNVNKIKYKFYVWDTDNPTSETLQKLEGNIDNTFLFEKKWDNVFCIGNIINDFHILDKNNLFITNFSATKEIDKQVQTLVTIVKKQQDEIDSLKIQIQNITALLTKNNII